MTAGESYVCFAIIDWQPRGVAVETISVNEGVSSLSGAWYLDAPSPEDVFQLVSGALVIQIGTPSTSILKSHPKIKSVDIPSFLAIAKGECLKAFQEYGVYKAEKLAKRKNLVEPDFTNWPDELNLEEASFHLVQLGRAASINGTDAEMERVLSASRLVKWMIDGWLHDEAERNQRSYLSAAKPAARLLPDSWLQILRTEKQLDAI